MKKLNLAALALTIMMVSNYGHCENITILIKNNNNFSAISASFSGSGTAHIPSGNQMPLHYTGPTYATAVECRAAPQQTVCNFPESAIDNKTLVVGAPCYLSGDAWSANLTLTCS